MIRIDHCIGRLLTAAMVLTVVGAGQPSPAQDIEIVEDDAAVVQQPQRGFIWNDAQFDVWVFGNMGGNGNAGVARNRLDALLTLHVEDVERSCGLTAVQRKKLLVAGRGDIKRFFDRVEEARKKFDKIKHDQNQIGMIWQEIQPLQATFNAGLFNDESIFTKALKATLSQDQVAQYQEVQRERTLYRYRARVDLALELLNNSVGFSAEQRERVLKVLVEETRPPKRLGQNDYYAVLYQLSKVPEAKLKAIFDDVQWRFLERQLMQAKGLEMWLKQNGFVPDEGPAPTPAHRPPARRANRYVAPAKAQVNSR
jgi:hypothetical protein